MTATAVDAADARAFGAAMAALGPFEKKPTLALAVSGGVDSVALSLLARDWVQSVGGKAVALTVDHGLRRDSAAEARLVGEWMRRLGLRHRILTLPPCGAWRSAAGGLQASARLARYAVLTDWCRANGVLHLLVAHHRDDQAETFLERLSRGSGLNGLAGMASLDERDGVRVLRPLLGMPRAALAAAVEAAGHPWVEDESNEDARFQRIRFRRSRYLLEAEGLTAGRLSDTIGRLGRARQAMEHAVAHLMARAVAVYPQGFAEVRSQSLMAAPAETGLRALARLLQAVGGTAYPPREARLERLYQALVAFAAAPGRMSRTLGGCRLIGRADGTILVCREMRDVAGPVPVEAAGETVWDGRFAIRATGAAAGLQVGAAGKSNPEPVRAVLSALPAPVRPTVPALLRDGEAVALPLLGWRGASAPPDGAVTLCFRASPVLAGGRFTVA